MIYRNFEILNPEKNIWKIERITTEEIFKIEYTRGSPEVQLEIVKQYIDNFWANKSI